MKELGMGDLRHIDESLNGWRMSLNIAMGGKKLPQGTVERIEALAEEYKNEYREFFLKARNSGTDKNASEIHNEFDEQWNEKHPGFFDVEALVRGVR